MILFYEFYPLNALNIYYSSKHLYIRYNLLLQQHFYSHLLLFYVYYLPSTKSKYIVAFNLTNSLTATPPVSSFIFPMTNLFESS